MKIFLHLLCLIFLPLLVSAQDEKAMYYGKLIEEDSLKSYIYHLASDRFEGRETGTNGQKLAAEYIADHFRVFGLRPGMQDSYFQEVPLIHKKPGSASCTINGRKFNYLEDFYFFPGCGETSLDLHHILALGYGISDSHYDDYDGISAESKTLMFLPEEPVDSKGNSYITGNSDLSAWTKRWREKAAFARDKRPAAVLLIVDSIQKIIRASVHSIESGHMELQSGQLNSETAPVIYISVDMANAILSAQKLNTRTYSRKICSTGKPQPLNIACHLILDYKTDNLSLKSENVLGFLEGSDPVLKNEILVITAHYDHLGKSGNNIFYGADDDASGTSAVMEISRIFSKARNEGNGPARSILFMAFTGEEKGLLGSSYFSEHPPFPFDSIITDLNIDMIGRIDEFHSGNPNYIYLIGSDKISRELHNLSERVNSTYSRMELDYKYNKDDDPNRFYYRSDHYNFAKKDVPVIFYFNGTHKDYHKPSDTPDKINYSKVRKVSQLIFYTAWEIANTKLNIKPGNKTTK